MRGIGLAVVLAARKRSVYVVAGVVMAACLTMEPALAGTDDQEPPPTFTKGKFAIPICREAVEADWTARGYSNPKMESYVQGWSRGEHTHPVNLIMTIVTGRMEFVFGTQRFVVEPGDEIFYAAHTVHSARNLYDGTTQMMEGSKR